jgi:hypothetical protein
MSDAQIRSAISTALRVGQKTLGDLSVQDIRKQLVGGRDVTDLQIEQTRADLLAKSTEKMEQVGKKAKQLGGPRVEFAQDDTSVEQAKVLRRTVKSKQKGKGGQSADWSRQLSAGRTLGAPPKLDTPPKETPPTSKDLKPVDKDLDLDDLMKRLQNLGPAEGPELEGSVSTDEPDDDLARRLELLSPKGPTPLKNQKTIDQLTQAVGDTGSGRSVGDVFLNQGKFPTSVSRSDKGSTGVYFTQTISGKHVVKPSDHPNREYFSTCLAKAMGLRTPTTSVVDKETLVPVMKGVMDRGRSVPSGTQQQFTSAMKDKDHALVMEHLDISTFETTSVPLGDKLKSTDKAQLFRDLGRQHTLDLLIHNADRLPLTSDHPGNTRNTFIGGKTGSSDPPALMSLDQEPTLPRGKGKPEAYVAAVGAALQDLPGETTRILAWMKGRGGMGQLVQTPEDEKLFAKEFLQGMNQGGSTIKALVGQGVVQDLYAHTAEKYGDSDPQGKDLGTFLGSVGEQFRQATFT